ncbi:PREDICTED: acyl-CoA-binding domain-containing protein 5-like isoform X2 [Priapulus caudatus]|nr:PREDICTED: acyl-CoA-binding domain-containing protein 5-like isoform X2 [Priapulus caudatus]
MPQETAMEKYVEDLKQIVETMAFTDKVADFLTVVGPFYIEVPLGAEDASDSEDKLGVPIRERLGKADFLPMATPTPMQETDEYDELCNATIVDREMSRMESDSCHAMASPHVSPLQREMESSPDLSDDSDGKKQDVLIGAGERGTRVNGHQSDSDSETDYCDTQSEPAAEQDCHPPHQEQQQVLTKACLASYENRNGAIRPNGVELMPNEKHCKNNSESDVWSKLSKSRAIDSPAVVVPTKSLNGNALSVGSSARTFVPSMHLSGKEQDQDCLSSSGDDLSSDSSVASSMSNSIDGRRARAVDVRPYTARGGRNEGDDSRWRRGTGTGAQSSGQETPSAQGTSHAGEATTVPSSSSGAGGDGGRGSRGAGRTQEDVGEQIALTLIRLQQDMENVLARLSALETLSITQHNYLMHANNHQSAGARQPQGSLWSWLFPRLPARTVVFMVGWPFAAFMLLKFIRSRQRVRRLMWE